MDVMISTLRGAMLLGLLVQSCGEECMPAGSDDTPSVLLNRRRSAEGAAEPCARDVRELIHRTIMSEGARDVKTAALRGRPSAGAGAKLYNYLTLSSISI